MVPAHSINDDNDWFTYWGYAQQNGKQDEEIVSKIGNIPDTVDLEKVSVFVVNLTRLFEKCLKNENADREFLANTFDRIINKIGG